jgi:hypothetical protein
VVDLKAYVVLLALPRHTLMTQTTPTLMAKSLFKSTISLKTNSKVCDWCLWEVNRSEERTVTEKGNEITLLIVILHAFLVDSVWAVQSAYVGKGRRFNYCTAVKNSHLKTCSVCCVHLSTFLRD